MAWKLVRCWLQMTKMGAQHCCLQEVREVLEGLVELKKLEERRWEEQRWEAGQLVGCLMVRLVNQLKVLMEDLLERALGH